MLGQVTTNKKESRTAKCHVTQEFQHIPIETLKQQAKTYFMKFETRKPFCWVVEFKILVPNKEWLHENYDKW